MGNRSAMQIHFGLSNLVPEWSHSIVCIGTFDGVHLGHQAVISRAVEQAEVRGFPCCVVTFDRHPAAVLHPDRCPPSISTLEENLEKFAQLRVSATVILPFDRELSELPAERFLSEIVVSKLGAQGVVVGHDFAMGKGRVGDSEWLRKHIPTEVVPPFEIEGRRVSSSAIRAAVKSGDVEEATHLLGRPYCLAGIVVGGQRLGRQLGFPTANLARSSHQILPADGIYAACWTSEAGSYWAALSIGVRPAVGGGARTVEAYLLDYHGGEFYGQASQVAVLRRLRGEQDFDSLEALVLQIRQDVEQVREFARKEATLPSLVT